MEMISNSCRVVSRSALNLRASGSLYRELEEWERLDDPEEPLAMAGVVAGAEAGFHWMSLEAQRRSSGMKKDLKGAVKKPTITTSRERRRGSLRPRR
jgi:hypothetical protein